MNEWTVVTVLIAIVGLFVTVAKPIVGLNNNITRLSENVERLEGKLAELGERNSDTHRRLWDRGDEQAQRIEDHETRISVLERK